MKILDAATAAVNALAGQTNSIILSNASGTAQVTTSDIGAILAAIIGGPLKVMKLFAFDLHVDTAAVSSLLNPLM